MSTTKKALSEARKQLQELESTLEALYLECGEALFKYEEHTGNTGLCVKDSCLFCDWQQLREKRNKHTQDILSIKTAVTRRDELKKFLHETEKMIDEQQYRSRKAAASFTLALFETYYEQQPEYLAFFSDDVEPLQDALREAEADCEDLERKKAQAHFFQKISIGTQAAMLKTKQASLKKKIEKKLTESAEAFCKTAGIAELCASGSLPEELSGLYTEFVTCSEKAAEITERKNTLLNEEHEIRESLSVYEAAENPNKRIAELTGSIQELDKAILRLERETAGTYADAFYTEQGTPAETNAESTGEDHITAYITSIGSYRMQRFRKKLHITYLENEITIETESDRIKTMCKALEVYHKKIAEYEQMIEKTEKEIAEAEKRKNTLAEKNTGLFPLFSD